MFVECVVFNVETFEMYIKWCTLVLRVLTCCN